jgi:MYXO-CTERM domain-containing protein
VATWQDDGNGFFTLGKGRVDLPGVDSATDGMLFVAPSSDTSNGTHIAAGAPRNGGWDVTVRQDQGDGLGEFPINPVGSSGYQFLYVPYNADGLVGGLIDGATGNVVKGASQTDFDLERTAAGEYALSVTDGATALTGDDGMLVLSVASHDAMFASGDVAARTMLSYEFDSASGKFIIQSRLDAAIEGGTSIFGDLLELTDTDFYFAWIDFTNPLSPDATTPGVLGDTDDDGDVDLTDLNNVRNNFGSAGTPVLGDTNTDGLVDLTDLNNVRNNFGASAPVPEPATWALGLVGLAALGWMRRRR